MEAAVKAGEILESLSLQGGHFPDHIKFPDFSSSLDR